MATKIIKNNTQTTQTWCGHQFAVGESYTIPDASIDRWANNSNLLVAIANSEAIVNNGSFDITDVNKAIDYLKNNLPAQVESATFAFASKMLPDGKKIYRRVHGLEATVSGSPDTIEFNIPYDNCKINGIEIIGGRLGDKLDLYVLDTPTGTISGTPNAVLNQFGYGVRVANELHRYMSNYDADLIKDMKIKIVYDSTATLPAIIYANIFLHEVK